MANDKKRRLSRRLFCEHKYAVNVKYVGEKWPFYDVLGCENPRTGKFQRMLQQKFHTNERF